MAVVEHLEGRFGAVADERDEAFVGRRARDRAERPPKSPCMPHRRKRRRSQERRVLASIGRMSVSERTGRVPSRGPHARLHRLRRGPADRRAAARPAPQPAHARAARPQPRRARQPRDHARPARPRRARTGRVDPGVLDDLLRRADDRAARPPRDRGGGRARHLAGGQHRARGVRLRARAAARHGHRDAGARQRAAGLRARVHAADDRAELRRADDARGPARRAPGPEAAVAGSTSSSTPCARTPPRAPRCCRGCSSAASPRTARAPDAGTGRS